MSLPACLSIADVPLRQSDTVASLRHRSWWCNALWDVVTIHLSLPLTLVFPTLAIAPSAWQRPYRKCSQVDSEPSPCNIKSPWQRPFISFASPRLHYRLMPNMVNFHPPSSPALPLCLRFYNSARSSRVHRHQRFLFFFHAGCEWKEEASETSLEAER